MTTHHAQQLEKPLMLAIGVQRALGRPPKDFANYAREAAASGVWDAASIMASALLAIGALPDRLAPGAAYRLAGSLLYLIGAVAVTIAFNVPRDNALGAVDPESDAGEARWARYVRSWTALNTLRMAAAIAAALALILALVAER